MLCMLLFFGLLFFLFKRYDDRRPTDGQSIFDSWRNDYHRPAPESKEDSAMKTARERLAKGELSPEEFEAIKEALS